MSDGITPLNPEQLKVQEEKASHEGYLHRVAVEVDDLGNVATGGLPDETISSRLARAAEKHELIGEIGTKGLDLIQRDHGAKAQAADLYRADEVAAVEDAAGGFAK